MAFALFGPIRSLEAVVQSQFLPKKTEIRSDEGHPGNARTLATYWRQRVPLKLELYDFRNALPIVEQSYATVWREFQQQLESISANDISELHRGFVRAAVDKKRRPQAGAQTAINQLIDRRLGANGWRKQPPLYVGGDRRGHELAGWKMDFKKERVGVEIAFNHQEAIPWIFTRLNLAGESKEVLADSRIQVGIAAFAAQSLKAWGRMDATVGTFGQAKLWLEKMRPVMPVPIVVVGLSAADPDGTPWPLSDAFRGTLKGRAYGKEIELPEWLIAERLPEDDASS